MMFNGLVMRMLIQTSCCGPMTLTQDGTLLMNDILVPATPADLIGQIIDLQLQLDTRSDAAQRTDLINKRALLMRLAERVLPANDTVTQLTLHLSAARSDIHSLTADLYACDDRKDYGTGFIALTQALLTAQRAADTAYAAINAHLAHSPPLRDRNNESA
jgi:hypothetical protein